MPSSLIPRIAMAPLQGLTGYVFRSVFLQHFSGIDHSYCPFVRLKAGALRPRDERELAAGAGQAEAFTPQLLASEPEEARVLSDLLLERGFRRANLNLGCPYPMETKRGKGAGLLPQPEQVVSLLDVLCAGLQVSVKTRLGLDSAEEFAALVPVFNGFPLEEIIVHPRMARQMYAGEVQWDVFGQLASRLRAPVIANGDILTVADAQRLLGDFPWLAGLMIGRGLLRDPFLPAAIQGLAPPEQPKRVLRRFHDELIEAYGRAGLSPHHVVDKLKALWVYLADSVEGSPRIAKRLRQVRDLPAYRELVEEVLG